MTSLLGKLSCYFICLFWSVCFVVYVCVVVCVVVCVEECLYLQVMIELLMVMVIVKEEERSCLSAKYLVKVLGKLPPPNSTPLSHTLSLCH